MNGSNRNLGFIQAHNNERNRDTQPRVNQQLQMSQIMGKT